MPSCSAPASIRTNRGNGIYLRARALRRKNNDGTENPNYRALREHDEATGSRLAQRTYHVDTFRRTYLTRLREGLRAALDTHNDRCSDGGAGSRASVLPALSALADKLIAGTMNLGQPVR